MNLKAACSIRNVYICVYTGCFWYHPMKNSHRSERSTEPGTVLSLFSCVSGYIHDVPLPDPNLIGSIGIFT